MPTPRPDDADGDRYDRVAAALHWIIGVALLAQVTFGFLLDDIAPRGTSSRAAVINLHKSFGIVLGLAIVLPASGYVASNFSKHGVKFFGRPVAPWGPDLPTVYDALNGLHVATGWLFAALIGGHVLAALQHAWIARDGIFGRIWPWRTPRAVVPADPLRRSPS